MRKLPEEERQQIKAFRIHKNDYERACKLAARMGMSFSDFTRIALELYMVKCMKDIRLKQIGLFNEHGYNKDINDIIG